MKHKINRTCQTGLLFVLGLIHGSAQSKTQLEIGRASCRERV